MRYAETLLSEGEIVVLRSRQHWLALLLDARTALALWVVAAVLLFSVLFFRIEGQGANILSWAAVVALVIGLVLFAYRFWQWWAQDYLVTNRRLLKVEGILNKRSADSSLEKINDAILDQNVLGRILDYGDLDILTAADTAIDRYRMLNHAKGFKREMLNQKHALEMEFSYRQPPSPPLRAAGPMNLHGEATAAPAWAAPPAPSASTGEGAVTGTASPGADEAVAAATATPPPARPPEPARSGTAGDEGTPSERDADSSREITQTLARLADLRDRGAITAEEYEGKKDELLGRL
jgi:hypothetical protein